MSNFRTACFMQQCRLNYQNPSILHALIAFVLVHTGTALPATKCISDKQMQFV